MSVRPLLTCLCSALGGSTDMGQHGAIMGACKVLFAAQDFEAASFFTVAASDTSETGARMLLKLLIKGSDSEEASLASPLTACLPACLLSAAAAAASQPPPSVAVSVSNPARPRPVADKWNALCYEEFYAEGDVDRAWAPSVA
eukprot:COSAG01_NODE_2031_length_8555_cov_4.407778_4_plen_143_part_00